MTIPDGLNGSSWFTDAMLAYGQDAGPRAKRTTAARAWLANIRRGEVPYAPMVGIGRKVGP